MLTEKDYCDFDTCVALEELGFNNLVNWYFNEEKSIVSSLARYRNTYIPRISLYEAQKWLREERRIEANAFYDNMDAAWRFYILEIDSPDLSGTYAYNYAYMSYEEALLEGIKKAIKILSIC